MPESSLAAWLLAAVVLFIVVSGFMLVRLGRRANGADWGHAGLNVLDGLNRLFCRYYHRFEFDPIELPESGCAIVVCNHVSGLDPMLMIAASRRPLRFLIATEQYDRFGLRWLFDAIGCIPVDRGGRPEKAMRHALARLQQGEVVALFPHGGIHLDSDPPKRIKAGAARLAQRAGCAIYPTRVTGIVGAGHVVRGVAQRSRARLHTFEPYSADCCGTREFLDQLTARLEGRADDRAGRQP